ncbi:MAG: glycosyltransferase family 39 protein, partial [Pirellulaceae bacterium]
WLDELHSAWVVSSGLSEIAARAQVGNQSPLYFYLPWATTSLFGMSEWSLRLPSLVAGVGLVMLAYGLAYEFTRSRLAAIACATLAAVDHNFLFYATETRPYAWVQLVAAIQLYFFWQLQDGASVGRRIAFVASNVLLFYLHYTAILLVAGEVVYLLTRSRYARPRSDRTQYTFSMLVIDLLCMAVMMIPAAVHVLDVGSRREAWSSFISRTSLTLPVHWFSLISYGAVPAMICVGRVARRRLWGDLDERSFEWRPAYLLACWLCMPLAIAWILTIMKVVPLYLGRYVIGAALAPVLFAGLCVGAFGARSSRAIVAGVIIAYAVYSSGMIEQVRYDGRLFGDRVENWRDAVAFVNDDPRSDVPVFVRSGLLEADRLATDESELLREYCVSPVTSIYKIEDAAREIRPLTTSDAGRLTSKDVQQIEKSGAAWFIINGNAATTERCRTRVLDSLTNAVVLDERQFGNVGAFLVVLFAVDD